MTPPDTPRPAAVDQRSRSVVRVREPGELVAAVPVMIGFHPRESLVLLATGGSTGRRLGLTLRVDLPPPEHLEDVGAAAVSNLLLDSPAGAAVVVVGDGADGGPTAHLPHSSLVDVVVRRLEAHGIDAHTVLWAASTAAGAPWRCYDPCGCGGVVPDPSATAFAAAAVVEGQVVHADRADLERLVAPADAERIRRREVLLIREVDAALAGPDTDVESVAAGWAVVDTAIADAAGGRLVLDDAWVLALAGALVVPAVRDAALLRCAGPEAAAAEQLWTALVRETPDPEAAEPAALLATSALLRGDGALANVALDRAERAWPGHRLTGILRSVAQAGMRPEQVRTLLGQDLGGPIGAARRPRAGGSRTAGRRIVRGRRRPR